VCCADASSSSLLQAGLLLLVHGEVTDPAVDFFDREAVFIERHLAPLLDKVGQPHEYTTPALIVHHVLIEVGCRECQVPPPECIMFSALSWLSIPMRGTAALC